MDSKSITPPSSPSPSWTQLSLKRLRQLHIALAPIVILPLMVTMVTGVVYRIGKDWLGWTRDQVHFLMVIHEGEYWGETLEPVYVLLNGLGLLWMLATGTAMLVKNWQRSRRSAQSLSKSTQNPAKSTQNPAKSIQASVIASNSTTAAPMVSSQPEVAAEIAATEATVARESQDLGEATDSASSAEEA